jgi:hypothetical protein
MDLFEIKLRKKIRNIIMESEFGYTIIGYVKDSTLKYVLGDYYILLRTSFLNSNNPNEIRKNLIITTDKEGSSSNYAGYLNEGLKNFVHLLPQYKGTAIEEAILGLSQNTRENKAKELMNSIRQENGMAILTHNSPNKIVDGYVKIGMPMNRFSMEDFKKYNKSRAYFWGTEFGKDISGSAALYKYICEMPIEKIYPSQFNPHNYENGIEGALNDGYEAIAYYMDKEDKSYGTVVASFVSLPIKEIQSLRDLSVVYNSKWERIN